METVNGAIFEIDGSYINKNGNDFVIYTVYDKRQFEVFYESLAYIAKVEISKTTGEVVDIKTGSGCTPSQVVEIINTSSYIATGYFGREDPVTYLSIILSSCMLVNGKIVFKPKDPNTDIRFSIYGTDGAEDASKIAVGIIDEYFCTNLGSGKKLIIPYAVNEESKNIDGNTKNKIDHIVLLVVEEIKEKTKQKKQRIEEGQEKIKYKIQCFGNSLTFFQDNKHKQIDHIRYFGLLVGRSEAISQLNNDKLIKI